MKFDQRPRIHEDSNPVTDSGSLDHRDKVLTFLDLPHGLRVKVIDLRRRNTDSTDRRSGRQATNLAPGLPDKPTIIVAIRCRTRQ